MGKRTYAVKGSKFEVDDRYKVLRGVGAGSSGLVCAATDMKTKKEVAIKKISVSCAVECKRVLRELKLLAAFEHENILHLKDLFLTAQSSTSQWKDIYVVTDLLDGDLHTLIKSPQPLTNEHIQVFIYQTLRALDCLHQHNVIHRDIKPGNLLIDKACNLKLADFGLSRSVDPSAPLIQQKLTEYVVTRWYRAPELLVENNDYSAAVDMWSVGCILAEFLGRKAFLPGRDYLHQVQLIIHTLGTPAEEDLSFIQSQEAVQYIKAG